MTDNAKHLYVEHDGQAELELRVPIEYDKSVHNDNGKLTAQGLRVGNDDSALHLLIDASVKLTARGLVEADNKTQAEQRLSEQGALQWSEVALKGPLKVSGLKGEYGVTAANKLSSEFKAELLKLAQHHLTTLSLDQVDLSKVKSKLTKATPVSQAFVKGFVSKSPADPLCTLRYEVAYKEWFALGYQGGKKQEDGSIRLFGLEHGCHDKRHLKLELHCETEVVSDRVLDDKGILTLTEAQNANQRKIHFLHTTKGGAGPGMMSTSTMKDLEALIHDPSACMSRECIEVHEEPIVVQHRLDETQPFIIPKPEQASELTQ